MKWHHSLVPLSLLLLAACGTLGSESGVDDPQYHRHALPSVAMIPHPDSITADPDETMSRVRRKWSVRYLQRSGSRDYAPLGFTTSATLWSRELTEFSLRREVGTSDLSPDLQESMRAREVEAYESQVSFDVYMFVANTTRTSLSDVRLGGPGGRVVLQVDDERYSPSSITGSGILVAGHSVFQRVNHVTFPRIVDDRDILDGAEEIRLLVSTSGVPSDELAFTWRIRD